MRHPLVFLTRVKNIKASFLVANNAACEMYYLLRFLFLLSTPSLNMEIRIPIVIRLKIVCIIIKYRNAIFLLPHYYISLIYHIIRNLVILFVFFTVRIYFFFLGEEFINLL